MVADVEDIDPAETAQQEVDCTFTSQERNTRDECTCPVCTRPPYLQVACTQCRAEFEWDAWNQTNNPSVYCWDCLLQTVQNCSRCAVSYSYADLCKWEREFICDRCFDLH